MTENERQGLSLKDTMDKYTPGIPDRRDKKVEVVFVYIKTFGRVYRTLRPTPICSLITMKS